ncbi:hypothetical protein SAMN05428974_0195 [Sphingopyxis sp. YR583]|uniref:hypothetical protein n=1 Tax=Sphingopyxis sp. YR583 TaxID=1881047 RepID=UPI0008A79CBF|nr:hypothetical protein [Sphingopyxis sp. YR583]SEH11328.1 hypothetical protein SAMN05428974_0195 [Sphingopyxis sp. YR583]
MRFSSLTLGLATFVLASPAMANTPVVPRQLAKMDADAFRAKVTIDDDELEYITIISTREGFRKEQRLTSSASFDSHVEAHVNKRTGETRFEVHQFLRYRGSQRLYDTVHFADHDNELVVRPLDYARRGDDSMCPNSDFAGDCALTMRLMFSVDETSLRAAIDRGDGWDLKFKGSPDGRDDFRIRIVSAEIEGLLLAVGDYRATLPPHVNAGGLAAALR